MSQVRRSSRIHSRSIEERDTEEGRVGEVQTDGETTVQGILSDESDNEANDDDSEYEEPSQRKKRKINSKSGDRAVKKAKNSANERSNRMNVKANSRKDKEELERISKDFEATELFEILATSEDYSVDELLRDWLGTYIENRDQFLQEFINLLLCCTGAIARVENHDVHSNESSNETIGEVQLMFQRQHIHEFHLLISKKNKKRSKYQPLYENFVEFMSRLMESANELQLLYCESTEVDGLISTSPLVLDLLTWLSALSVCKLRALRYVSTLTLYLFQDFLTEHVVDLERNYLSKLSKQLAVEQRKKRSNTKTIEKLESAIEEVQSSKMVTQNIIDNIIKVCFVHRFKDVDDTLRCMSMIHLSTWIRNYPEYFLKVTFLKYFGWLLSDSSAEVRMHVLRVLPQIITRDHNKAVDNSAIRQFFERFKERLLEIASKDENLEVRMNAVNVLIEVVTLGYLEEHENLQITSLIFDDNQIKVTSYSKHSRLLGSLAKFFSQVVIERCEEFTKNHDIIDETIYGIRAASAIKIGILASLLNQSLLINFQKEEGLDSEAKIAALYQASEFLYPYFSSLLQDLCQLLSYDGEYDHPDLLDNSENIHENDESYLKLLLPNDSNNIILYVTTLNGLCCGGVNMKNQPKLKVAKIILPQLDILFSQLPLHSSNVLSSVMRIFNLFTFEDWIQSGHEKSIVHIAKRIVRAFIETRLSSKPTDTKFKAFSETIQVIHSMNLIELDELWLNQITHLKIQLSKYLDEYMALPRGATNVNERIDTLYTMFINKLGLLGKTYPIEFDNALLSKLLIDHISKIPDQINQYEQDIIELINFKLLTLLITCQLQKWTDIFEKATSTESIPHVPLPVLQSIAKILSVMNSTLLELHGKAEMSSSRFLLTWQLVNSFIDNVVALNVIELRLPEVARSWTRAFKEIFPPYLPSETQFVISQVFLYLESLFAKEINVPLDRFAEEEVYFNDIKEDVFGDESERQLLVFLLKLKGLSRLGLLGDEEYSRIKLNKGKLGPLYESIVDDTFFQEGKKTERQLKNHLQPAQKLLSINEESPAEEMYSDVDMLQNDPIVDSEI